MSNARRTSSGEPPVAAPVAELERWFKANARGFPWRRDRTPWRALVSEFMLQQTQASRVAERFDAVMADFPTPAHLARAPLDALLKHWQGLGYYRRARFLHETASAIVDRFGGETPTEARDLRTLPGVGRYTAGSVASIAGGHREPIVDGNVRRVLSRLAGDHAPVGDARLEARTWERAKRWVEAAADPALCNEGLMELGAVVCTPAKPTCDRCPLAPSCAARRSGQPESCPGSARAKVRPTEFVHSLVVRRGGRILLEQRGDQGRFAGTWQPPTSVGDQALDAPTLRRTLGLATGPIQPAGEFEHLLTHRRLIVRVFEAPARSGARLAVAGRRWVDPARNEVPLSSLVARVIAQASSCAAPSSPSG